MTDVKVERRQSLSREDAAVWLHALSEAFRRGGQAELPIGAGGTVGLHLPERVQAEFEIEVDGDQVEVEVEFTWSTSKPGATGDGARASDA